MLHDPDRRSPRCAACRHERAVHEHCRAGTDCGRCDCAAYRVSFAAVVRSLVRRRRRAPSLTR
ncbi:hypothetical protein [Geodermatophilus pulveris]|uniref:hypothetical protein n=1 Tax=Geodermatophilus pulveris TaxID=1564159 RepID=UPI00117A3971|nr:hypothetical protein [Geodermatophilus pulveris]